MLSVKNNTTNFLDVNSHDIVLSVNGKISNSYKIRDKITLFFLKPTESLHLEAVATLGIWKLNAIYAPITIPYYELINDNRFVLKFETKGQMTKDSVFLKSCIIMQKKLRNIKNFLKTNYTERKIEETIFIELYGEEDTIGNVLANILQKSGEIIMAGYIRPIPSVYKIDISYKLRPDSKYKPIQLLLNCIDYAILVFAHLKIQYEKII